MPAPFAKLTVESDALFLKPATHMKSPSLPAAERYPRDALARLQTLLDVQPDALDRAAALCIDTIVDLALSFHNLIVGPNGLRQSLHLNKTDVADVVPIDGGWCASEGQFEMRLTAESAENAEKIQFKG